jgi:maltooligosyltrehalose trehalohydrolase
MTPFGANAVDGGIEFKVWSSNATCVDVIIYESSMHTAQEQAARKQAIRMQANDDGIFSVTIPSVTSGTLYKFRIDEGNEYPDPYSRFQPEGPHGPSMVVDPTSYRWRDENWGGIELPGQVIYELHIGAFTEAGTFDAAIEKLSWLKSIGITVIEVMPVAEFPGKWNWGYDGVALFAPFHGYGDASAFKRFVDAAHAQDLAVILDVVYNHLGPDGNYLGCFAPQYFSTQHRNDWGIPFNLDSDASTHVREFIVSNACYWIEEFHLDGLRLDAACNIPDCSARHVLAELVERARAAAGRRKIIIIAEDEQQHSSWLRHPSQGGFGLDAMWNDDFHHAAAVAITGRRHAYYFDYLGRPQEFISAIKHGFLFQGQHYHWQKQPRGERFSSAHSACVLFLENHDQIANSLHGRRMHRLTSPARYRAMTALLLLAPQTPLLFMGQEFMASTPFLFFADHNAELAKQVRRGRQEFLNQFPGVATPQGENALHDPFDPHTFQVSKLKWEESEQHGEAVKLHRDLLRVRRTDPTLNQQNVAIDGAVLGEHSFLLRWFDADHGDRLLLMNLGTELRLIPGPEPLLAASSHCDWSLEWSSEDVSYGGGGVEHPLGEHGWYLPGECAIFLREVSALSLADEWHT